MPTARLSVEVIAHRGASAYAGEHTFDAFDVALEQGAHMLELDVRVTADGELVVLHDSTLRRTTGDPRAIGSVTMADLARIDAATRPPTLDAVLARYGDTTRWLIELKRPQPAWELRAVDAIERHGLREHAVVQSFDPRSLRRIRAAAPWVAVAPLFHRSPRAARRWERIASWATAVSIGHRSLNPGTVAAAHDHGLPVRGWTVDRPGDIERLVALGVDGVITNAPDIAGAVARRAAAGLSAALAA